ncbi:unnamed protein product, partial [Polarella glacialis]
QRSDPASEFVQRVTIVLVGPPGEGKSTQGNLLATGGSRIVAPAFQVSDGFESLASPVAYADFEFEGVYHRIIDTTGVFAGPANMADRLASCASYAAGGIDAFVFVLRKGRFTDELFDQLMAFQDAAGPGSLSRTVVAFTHCGRETMEQLIARCRQSQNQRLRDVVSRIPAIVGSESQLPARYAGDRSALLAATAGVCRAQRGAAKPTPMDPAEVRRALREMSREVEGLASSERRVLLREKMRGCEAGLASLAAVRAALQEARENQRREDSSRDERHVLVDEVRLADLEVQRMRGAAESLTARGASARRPHALSCCTPSCQDACTPCGDVIQEILFDFRKERETEIQRGFERADALAQAPSEAEVRLPPQYQQQQQQRRKSEEEQQQQQQSQQQQQQSQQQQQQPQQQRQQQQHQQQQSQQLQQPPVAPQEAQGYPVYDATNVGFWPAQPAVDPAYADYITNGLVPQMAMPTVPHAAWPQPKIPQPPPQPAAEPESLYGIGMPQTAWLRSWFPTAAART